MASTEENPKSVFHQLPRKDLAKFNVNERSSSESVAEFLLRNRITPEEIAWLERQPVCGEPSLRRLRTELAAAGFQDIGLQLSDDRMDIEFGVGLTPLVKADDSESLLRLWIQVFRAAGFCVGFAELGITTVAGPFISGDALVAPIDVLARLGAPDVLEGDH